MGKEVVVAKKAEEDYSIKPQAVTPSIDTSSWPLLLKNYDKRKLLLPPASFLPRGEPRLSSIG